MGRAVRTGTQEQGRVEFQLDDFFPHLINRASGLIRTDFESRSKSLGITIEKWRVLICLLTKGPQNITNLAKVTTIEVPTMSFLLNRMIKERLVARGPHEHDGRVAVIRLTERGRKITHQLLPVVRRYETIAFRGFSANQVKVLKKQLRAVLQNLGNLGEQSSRAVRPAGASAKRGRAAR